MTEMIQRLIDLANTRPSPVKFLAAIAPIAEALEGGSAIPDDAWLLLPSDMRAALLMMFIQVLVEAAVKR